jgi:pimeloyl-ACP methyl ester carboxylesterase
MLVDHPLISRRVFFPRPSNLEPTCPVEVGEAHLACYAFRRHPQGAMILHFHGNGELAAEYAAGSAEFFLCLGINVCFAEYRGYGASTGTPSLGAMLGDGEQIVRALGVPAERLVVFGRSLGSVYAIELARRLPRIAGLILESGIADLLECWPVADSDLERGGVTREELRHEMATHFDHRAKLQHYSGSLLVLHTAHDQLLDRSHAERLHAWGGGSDKRLVIFPSGNHNSILGANYLEYLREVAELLRRAGVVPVPGGPKPAPPA